MNETIIDTFGVISVIFYVISLLPQIFKMISTRMVDDISITFLLICTTGEIFYVLFCVYKDVGPIVWGGYFSLAFHTLMTVLWFCFKNNRVAQNTITDQQTITHNSTQNTTHSTTQSIHNPEVEIVTIENII